MFADMTAALRKRGMTRDQFLDWAEQQDRRWEFNGFEPVGMVGGSLNHSRMIGNLNMALASRLRDSACEALIEAGIATIGDAVRYPDALVTCTRAPGQDRLAPGVIVVFEVVSPGSSRIDHIDKPREYWAVPSIRRYVILEQTSAALTVFSRLDGQTEWTAMALTAEGTLAMPEIGIEIPIAEFYEGVDLPTADDPVTA